jgi:hypothetical protein
MYMLLAAHADLGKLNQSSDCHSSRGTKHNDAGIPELNGNGADNFETGGIVVLEDIDVPHVEKLDKFCLKLVDSMVLSPILPQYFTVDLQLLPMTLFVVDFAHDLHSS